MNKILLSERTQNALQIASKFAKDDRFQFRVNHKDAKGMISVINESNTALLQFLPREDFSNIEDFDLNNFKRFVGTLSLFDSPSLSIDTDSKYINISESDNASKGVILPLASMNQGEKIPVMKFEGRDDFVHITIKITEDTWEMIHKLIRLYGECDFTLVADNGIVSIRTGKDPKGIDCFKFDIGTCSKDKYLWNVLNSKTLLLLPKEECELIVYKEQFNRFSYPKKEYEFVVSPELGTHYKKIGETNE